MWVTISHCPISGQQWNHHHNQQMQLWWWLNSHWVDSVTAWKVCQTISKLTVVTEQCLAILRLTVVTLVTYQTLSGQCQAIPRLSGDISDTEWTVSGHPKTQWWHIRHWVDNVWPSWDWQWWHIRHRVNSVRPSWDSVVTYQTPSGQCQAILRRTVVTYQTPSEQCQAIPRIRGDISDPKWTVSGHPETDSGDLPDTERTVSC